MVLCIGEKFAPLYCTIRSEDPDSFLQEHSTLKRPKRQERSLLQLARLSKVPPKLEDPSKSPRRSRFSTEQLVPSRKGSHSSEKAGTSSCGLNKEVLNEDINLRVLLLPLSNSDASETPCEKSTIEVYSRSESVAIEIVRLSGATDHHFRSNVTSCEGSVRVVLPPKFRGAIYINNLSGPPGQVEFSVELRKCIDNGAVRLNPLVVEEDEDEIHLHSPKNIELHLDEKPDNVMSLVEVGKANEGGT
ncbi:hypothetical protein B0H34DRAFT_672009 [Crassisporium funariophilum]|nr:hypothetical protein B0H34DRAFT_672009 [Crassisporium funariophilum]